MTKFVVVPTPALIDSETVESNLGLRSNIIANVSDDGVYCYYPLAVNKQSPDDVVFETTDINELNAWKYQHGWIEQVEEI